MQNGKRLVEADWTLLHTCNFRCDYCFVPSQMLGEKIAIRASNEEWVSAFDRHDVNWHIHMTGGEPTVYPMFADLCERLTANNKISLNTNLTGKSIDEFASRVSPGKVVFINAGLHHKERSARGKLVHFVERARQLAEKDFNLMVSAVMSPNFIENAEAVRLELQRYGIVMVPKILRGSFEGQIWPRAYSPFQRKAVLRFLDLAEKELERLQDRGGQEMTIDLRLDRRLLGEGEGLLYKLRDAFSETAALEKMFQGKVCGAGRSFVSINSAGDVHRCSSKLNLGNLLKGTFAFMPRIERCDTSYCPYFCFKHTSASVLKSLRAADERLAVGAI
jgi:MoaA/NifB/PqqE/SkfB family radical SAM enzyme